MRFGRTYSTIALNVGPASVALCQLAKRRGGVALHRWGVLEDPLRSRLETDDICASAAERTARFVRQTGFRGRAATLVLRPPDVTFHAVTLPDAMSAAPRGAATDHAAVRGGPSDTGSSRRDRGGLLAASPR